MSEFDRLLLDHSDQMMFLVDPGNMGIVACNRAAARSLGYGEEQLLAKAITDVESSLQDVFYWQDARNACHERLVPGDYLTQLPVYDANPAGRELVHEMKQGIVDLFHRHGAAHLQVGKLYPYLRDRHPATVGLVRDLKRSVDPRRRMNPGALGL